MNLLMSYPKVNTDNLRKSIVGSDFKLWYFITDNSSHDASAKKPFFEDGEDYNTSNNVLEINNGVYKQGKKEGVFHEGDFTQNL
jgi:hypothetical protein